MIAIFENRGKQYKATVGDFLKLPKISELKKNDSVKIVGFPTKNNPQISEGSIPW